MTDSALAVADVSAQAPIDYEALAPDDFRALRLKQYEDRLGSMGLRDGRERLGGGVSRAGMFAVTEFDVDDPSLPAENTETGAPQSVLPGVTFDERQSLSDAVLPSKGCISEDMHRERLVTALGHTWLKPLGDLRGSGLGRKIILCGGGASLEHTLNDIRAELSGANPPLVMAVNKTHDYLIANGITPDYGVLMDPREHVFDYMTPTVGVKYLFGGSVDPRLWDKFKNNDVYLWHAAATEKDHSFLRDLLKKRPWLSIASIPGPSTVGLRALNIIIDVLECPSVEMHGFDSCYAPQDGALWAYHKPVTFEHSRVDFTVISQKDGKKLRVYANADMSRQVYEFDAMMELMRNSYRAGVRKRLPKIMIAGDGAIPWMAWCNGAHATSDRMKAKYGQSHIYDYRTNTAEMGLVAPMTISDSQESGPVNVG